jgi:hypothetical protein
MIELSEACKTRLFRMAWDRGDGELVHVYVLADSRETARAICFRAVAAIAQQPNEELTLFNLNSWRDLSELGLSEDEDMRVFEVAWNRHGVTDWVKRPLFLIPDPAVASKWAELQADLAAERAAEWMARAAGRA